MQQTDVDVELIAETVESDALYLDICNLKHDIRYKILWWEQDDSSALPWRAISCMLSRLLVGEDKVEFIDKVSVGDVSTLASQLSELKIPFYAKYSRHHETVTIGFLIKNWSRWLSAYLTHYLLA